jgi:glycosyltransferase involved in cell wall biosynthesis
MFSDLNRIIVLVGPIARIGDVPRGGYQACNQRTLVALINNNVRVVALCYPEPVGSRVSKAFSYFLGFSILLWKLIVTKKNVIHITGLYKHFIYAELLFVFFSKFSRCKVIYDIRAGSAIRFYYSKSSIYRWAFRSVLLMSDKVMIEGAEYLEFVRTISGKTAFLLPNHVSLSSNSDNFRQCLNKLSDSMTLIYAGRLVQSKGIDVVLGAASILRMRKLRVKLKIVGSGESEYVSQLKSNYSHPDNEWLGLMAASEVLANFSISHFFLFPTIHPGEGHSNALTEAMAAGCVPITSENGFNKSVVGVCGCVLPLSATKFDYADAIIEILNNSFWSKMSIAAKKRARKKFDTHKIVNSLISEYQALGYR